jgi:hypothetical protein
MGKVKMIFLGIASFALVYVAFISEMIAKTASVACVTGLGEIPVPESLQDK